MKTKTELARLGAQMFPGRWHTMPDNEQKQAAAAAEWYCGTFLSVLTGKDVPSRSFKKPEQTRAAAMADDLFRIAIEEAVASTKRCAIETPKQKPKVPRA